jgi:hypothetical protein
MEQVAALGMIISWVVLDNVECKEKQLLLPNHATEYEDVTYVT